ncbi:MAG: hypothetical protein ACLPY5_14245 [Candidatus Bathyarchaeia archaeon]
MPPIWLLDLTLSMNGYAEGKYAWQLEGNYTLAAAGNIHSLRERLRDFAIPHFQRTIRRLYGMRVEAEQIIGRFQSEQQALAKSPFIFAELTEIVLKGRQHYARRLGTERIRFFRYDPEPEDENEADEAYGSEDTYDEANEIESEYRDEEGEDDDEPDEEEIDDEEQEDEDNGEY